MRTARTSPLHRALGLTLVETMVAVALTLLVCGFVAQMASTSLGTVHRAGTRVTATEKLDALRKRLAADLERVPLPSGTATLLSTQDSREWGLTLRVPVTQPNAASPWATIRYHWRRSLGDILRSERLDNATDAPQDDVIATGIKQLDVRWLANADSDPQAAANAWSSTTARPAAAMFEAHFTGAREEGKPGQAMPSDGAGTREFRWSIAVGG